MSEEGTYEYPASVVREQVEERDALRVVAKAARRYRDMYFRFKAGDSEWPTEWDDFKAIDVALYALDQTKRGAAHRT